jgi:hypothetical protein
LTHGTFSQIPAREDGRNVIHWLTPWELRKTRIGKRTVSRPGTWPFHPQDVCVREIRICHDFSCGTYVINREKTWLTMMNHAIWASLGHRGHRALGDLRSGHNPYDLLGWFFAVDASLQMAVLFLEGLPSGKHTKNYGKIHHFIAGKIHYFYGHGFNSYVTNYQRVWVFYFFCRRSWKRNISLDIIWYNIVWLYNSNIV